MKIYTFFDKKTKSYMKPFFAHNDGSAIRTFQDVVNESNPDNTFNKHPEDYNLVLLGDWNDDTGHVAGNDDGPVFLIGGLELVNETPEDAVLVRLARIEKLLNSAEEIEE